MTTTLFYNPTIITNVSVPNTVVPENPSIDWNYNPTALAPGAYATSKKPLYTISGLWMEKFLSNTSQLWCSGYNIRNILGTITGIELQLNIHRQSRIEDLLIQLTLGGVLIGNNLASTVNPVQSNTYTGDNIVEKPVGDFNIYGNSTELWGTTGLTAATIADPTFGIVLGFRSNEIYPHSDIVYLEQASLRITYA